MITRTGRRWLIATAAAAGLTAAAAPVADATPPGQDGRIATVVRQSDVCLGIYGCFFPNWRVVTINPDGSDPKDGQRQYGAATNPVYSHDGKRLLVTKLRRFPPFYDGVVSGPADGVINQPIRDRKPGRALPSKTEGYARSWTPDAKPVVNPLEGVLIRENPWRPLRSIYDNDTGGVLTDADLSPDGKTVAVILNPEGVQFAAADGSSRGPWIKPDQNTQFYGVDWSPDGQRVAIIGNIFAGDSLIWIVDRNGTVQARIPADGSDVAWSPSGTRLVYGNDKQLSVVNADGTGTRALPLEYRGSSGAVAPKEEAAGGVSWQPLP